jgi:hypothetical protein
VNRPSFLHIFLMNSQKAGSRWFRKKLQMQGAQKLRSGAHLQVHRSDEVAAQRRRWTFYETIIFKTANPCRCGPKTSAEPALSAWRLLFAISGGEGKKP